MKKRKLSEDVMKDGGSGFSDPVHVGRPNVGDKQAFLNYVDGIFERNWLTNDGELVRELERQVATYHDVRHCIAMCNGTIALEIAIRALGLEGEVIVPSYTFVATAHALHWQAIRPVFADIDPNTHNLDPRSVERMITPRTTGIIGVHLWGRPAPVEELKAIADNHGIKLMFDAAHAFGCSSDCKMVGSFGNCEVLSFHATKFFNTFEGGAVLTNDDELAETLRLMRNFGFSGMDNVIHPGTNGKMTEIAAAMGLVNLKGIDEVIECNRRNYEVYQSEFSDVPGIKMLSYSNSEKNNYQYVVIEVGDEFPASRDEVVKRLNEKNVRARKYFWPGCHNMTPYKDLYPDAGSSLPETVAIAERVVVLPTGMTLSAESVRKIATIVKTFQG